jgi:Flp pilus assembly protein TadG
MSSRLRCERGSVLVAGLLLSIALLMLLGAAVDLGHAFIVRRDLTAQADDAALAGSQALDLDALHQGQLALDPPQAQTLALGAITGSPGLQATVVASTGGVSVSLHEQIPTILLRLVGLSTLSLAAQATAAPRTP